MEHSAPPALLIYGATGYTGRLIAEEAARIGLDFAVAGRNRVEVEALAERLGVPGRVFALHDPITVLDNLEGTRVVLNVAGPFGVTAEPLIRAAISEGIHYLDTTAEFATYALAEERSAAAAAAGVMLVPGVGWDVVPSDAVAVHAASRTPRPVRLRIALEITGGFSRGSISSSAGIGDLLGLVRADGGLVRTPNATAETFDFGSGPEDFAPVPMGDLITAQRSLGLGNIAVFMRSTNGMPAPGDHIPDGPTEAERLEGRYRALAEVTDEDGTVVRSVIDTPNGYVYTQLSAVQAARRVLAGQHSAGFRTPSAAFGPGFATSIADSHITDL
ncbi:saccharopine dehydrogenase NADP-binding domain-containing protein [Rhodococcus sp. ARC_M12]|uniref:saccharopine dehydrogenase family protein n=1 Tax=unclassified Rhodococcus (in: high G+C Gram-positive bacteria) TaxID=192944 RepID=UPI001FB1E5A9|nr:MULTISPECIES: saccharopine dehydrogenase NADP-binding domain-containing protein [unclassified Rhodococcus (in: high G+C Gram-positive bacteria)]MCJ0893122.1 saccharopine dehydrogenase NADP-binding domain-containing protein [Rhodococcus sp. ARC_M5]MCJ0977331.1 saccharopine dehydrogenase NADP-binding domain-containing protein [Rhodococcus sp. ARC_M12]